MSMKPLPGSEIRRRFLNYFAQRGHEVVTSSSLVPHDDPTLLFTNAGMVQFKDVFTGRQTVPYKRAASVQKCVRAGGKHNDLENVGKTARHHTFFEMLGNFSFGDYFKREAIQFAWEFLTKDLGFPGEQLWATVFRDDDEARQLWLEESDIPAERIVAMDEEDNFWAMGDTGPCGPCSEIIIDRGVEYSCGQPDCALDTCGCDRWLELWNLVFMQFERDAQGNMTPLPKPSIDTGMGLERVAAVMQDVQSNFETDLLWPLIEAAGDMTGHTYDRGEGGFPLRVIADHVKAGTFLIADGVMPSNEFRGYVLRRILRRAIRFGKMLGQEQPFLYRLVPVVGQIMGEAYPEVVERADFVAQVMEQEEIRFHRTLHQGTEILSEIMERARQEGRQQIAGDEAFLLYDTYGFPMDLLLDAAEEAGMTVDQEGFEAAMVQQRERARQARQAEGIPTGGGEEAVAELPATRFMDCHALQGPARVLAIIVDGQLRLELTPADGAAAVILDQTPFYAEAGGQVGDQGTIATGSDAGDGGVFRVTDTQRAPGGQVFHWGEVGAGVLKVGDTVEAQVDVQRRRAIERNHTATHLLHRALKDVLGEQVNQAGSLVAPDRLRFDFTHFAPLTREELQQVEDIVNEQILLGLPVSASITTLTEARKRGAMALFGEKYGEQVRMVQIGSYSLELCGGCHVPNSAHVGLFKLTGSGGVAAGVRRVEAVTGDQALAHVRALEDAVAAAAQELRCGPEEVPDRVNALLERQRELEREIQMWAARSARQQASDLLAQAITIAGVPVVTGQAQVADQEALRQLGDEVRQELSSGVILLGAQINGRAQFVAMVTPDLVERGLHAGNLVRAVAAQAGGGGGGRPDMAQAGGRDGSAVPAALDHGRRWLEEQVPGLVEV